MNLYSKFATEFSQKRWRGWNGWSLFLKYVDQNLSCLDIGCGNSRLARFLLENNITIKEYFALDNSIELLEISRSTLSELSLNFKLIFANLEKPWINLLEKKKFNLITVFGVLHHMDTYEKRKSVIQDAYESLTDKGILVLTFWKFSKFDNFLKKNVIKTLEKVNLYDDDYILSFGEDKSTNRYAHSFGDEEIEDLIAEYKDSIVKTYESDGLENRMNKYIVLKK